MEKFKCCLCGKEVEGYGNDPHPILVGREGVVLSVGYDTIWVKWDNGRSLGLIIGLDVFEVIN